MVDVRITLAGIWVAMMLTFLLGDVIRIFAGHYTAGEMAGKPAGQWVWLLAATIMLIPIVMIVLTLTIPYPAIKWITIAAAVFQIVFNLVSLPYEGWYDNALIGVSVIFAGLIIYYAWTWPSAG